MKLQNSKRFEFDLKNLRDIAAAIALGLLAIYSVNTEVLNKMLEGKVGETASAIIIMILAYATKKYLTNYSINDNNNDKVL